MNNSKKITTVAISLLLLVSCHDGDPEPQFQEIFRKADVNADANLSKLVDVLGSNGSNGRSSETMTYGIDAGELQLDEIIERFTNSDQPGANYTIRLRPLEGSELTIEYLVLVAGQQGYSGYIIQFQPDSGNFPKEAFFEGYTGLIRILNLERTVKSTEYFKNGDQMKDEDGGGRTATDLNNCECKYVLKPYVGPITGNTIGSDVGISCECDVSSGSSPEINSPEIGTPIGEGSGGSSNGGGTVSGGGETIGFEEVAVADLAISAVETQLSNLTLPQLRAKYEGRMSQSELSYFDNNLSSAQKLAYLRNAYRAEETIKDLAPLGASLHNDKWDALRHAYLHGLTSENLGLGISITMGDLHEDFAGNPNVEKLMDLHNNQKGREIYSQLGNQDLTGHFFRTGLLISLINSMESGGLKKISSGTLVNTP